MGRTTAPQTHGTAAPYGSVAGLVHPVRSLSGGRFHCRMMWFSVDHQLWPSVKYGLCCSMATLPELEYVLLPFYGKMLFIGGHCANGSKRNPTTGPRILWCRPPTSRGGGNRGAVKQTADALWLRTALGTELQTSIGLLLVELGMSFQPFLLS